ncbi:hypothetical protein [Paraburkholderia susongensis]|uniref:Uncharacterized protein n=1 Tax=Paraburkholderia susongensis TaxID=1515439 RepID=A0A1X7JCP5_9BURK|nr:hypothetical protein [Paraburkholderia susongensis]SMG25683.1 hypothetical protein SAMN06265784_102461 [Paraburkholderia susongensis]
MKRSRETTLTAAGIALAATLATILASGTAAFAQTTAPRNGDSRSPMVKPPEAASGSGGAGTLDHMPIKRPGKAAYDRMTHEPPARGANAK